MTATDDKKPTRKRKNTSSNHKRAKDIAKGKKPVEDVQELVENLRIHQVELQAQNEELAAAKDEVASVRDRLADLWDFSPVGYLTLNKASVIEEANLTVCGMLGVEKSDLMGQRLTKFITPESQGREPVSQIAGPETRLSDHILLKLSRQCGKAEDRHTAIDRQ